MCATDPQTHRQLCWSPAKSAMGFFYLTGDVFGGCVAARLRGKSPPREFQAQFSCSPEEILGRCFRNSKRARAMSSGHFYALLAAATDSSLIGWLPAAPECFLPGVLVPYSSHAFLPHHRWRFLPFSPPSPEPA